MRLLSSSIGEWARGQKSTAIAVAIFSAALAVAVAPRPTLADDAAPAAPAQEPIVVGTPERIEVQPPQCKLDTPRRRMHLIVSGFYADGATQDLTRAAEFSSSNDKIAKVERGIVLPVANGTAQVTVRTGGKEIVVPVEVAGQDKPDRVSFQYGTLVALSKQGCNSGACHGSPSGKGGFRMSLRAYDPALDIETLVREAFNRRTNVYEPETSLLLRKPPMEVPHGGGRKLKKTDPAYELLRDWIAQGCQVDPPDAATCVKVDVYPRQRILKRPAHTQQLLVLAHFSDGTVRDVTDLAVLLQLGRGGGHGRRGRLGDRRRPRRGGHPGALSGQDGDRVADVPQGDRGLQVDRRAGEQLRRPPRVREAAAIADSAFGAVHRRGVRPPRVPGRDRRIAQRGRRRRRSWPTPTRTSGPS